VVVAEGCGGSGVPSDGGATRDVGGTRDIEVDATPLPDAGGTRDVEADSTPVPDAGGIEADARDAPATDDARAADADAAVDTPAGDAAEAGGPIDCGTAGATDGGDTRTDAAHGTFAEFPLPIAGSAPYFITAGHGKLWFSTGGGAFDLFSTITTDGCLTDYPGRADPLVGKASAITFALDGNVWFNQTTLGQIGHIALDGSSLWVFDLPPGSYPLAITLGPDGNLWFANYGTNAIERMTPEGVLTSFPTPTQFSAPSGLTNGPDGRLWFPERSPPAKIGSIDPATGMIEERYVPDNATPSGPIVLGPDGNIWFINYRDADGYLVTRLTPSGTFTDFPIAGGTSLRNITTGPDGNLWLTEMDANKIARLSPSNGIVAEYTVPTPDCQPSAITTGPDGNIWFTEDRASKIGRFTP
jgi:virginiamycin B lyase